MMRSVTRSSVRNWAVVSDFGPAAPAWATAACTSRAAIRSTRPAAAKAAASRFSASRLVISDIALPQFLGQILGRAPRQRDDGVRRVLVGVARERAAVGREHVRHLVHLAEAVDDAVVRGGAHANAADLVDDAAAGTELRAIVGRRRRGGRTGGRPGG